MGSRHGVVGRVCAHSHKAPKATPRTTCLRPLRSQITKHRDRAPELNMTLYANYTMILYNKNCKNTEISLCSKAGWYIMYVYTTLSQKDNDCMIPLDEVSKIIELMETRGEGGCQGCESGAWVWRGKEKELQRSAAPVPAHHNAELCTWPLGRGDLMLIVLATIKKGK